MTKEILSKKVTAFGRPFVMACDGLCHKAWGINHRPVHHFVPPEEDIDDYEFLADSELGIAPADPGTYEGGYGKPQAEEERLNKWCFRECERSSRVLVGEKIELRDFSQRVPNRGDRTPTPMDVKVLPTKTV